MRKSILLLFLLIFSISLFAKDIYVKVGSSGDGIKSSPYGTVDDALRDAHSGDVIHVSRGTYFGAGGSGLFVIDKPSITLVGGYNDDFSKRDPFKNITRLMRGASTDKRDCVDSPRCGELLKRQKIPVTKASYNPKGIIVGTGDSSNFIMDGFVIDGYTRHAYKKNNDLSLKKGPIGTSCVSFNRAGVKIRNSVVFNCAGPGISLHASGTKLDKKDKRESGDDWQEISNTFVFNTIRQNIDFRVGNLDKKNAPKGGAAIIKNCTLAFNWLKSGEDYNILQGRQTRLTVKNNILAFAGYGINNGFKTSRFGRYIDNIFYNHTSGHYRYMERSNSTLILDDPSLLSGKKCKKKYNCSKKSKNNVVKDPKFKNADKYFLDKFFNQIASSGGGKVTMDSMNQWRKMNGMPLQGSKGSGVVNFAPIWDPGKDWSTILIFSDLPNKGVQRNGIGGKFQVYKSKVSVAKDKDYKEMKWDNIKPRKPGVAIIKAKGDKGFDISVTLKAGSEAPGTFYLPASSGVKRSGSWDAFRDKTSGIYIYVKRGTEAYDLFKQSKSEGTEITIKGTAYELSSAKVANKIGIKVDSIESDDDD